MYPEGFATAVEVANDLTGVLEGDPEQRGPSHFRGVTTVVAKLFNSVQPDVAYFGRKDAQQAVVIERMTRDLDFPVQIEVLPTVARRRWPRAQLPQRLSGPRAAGARHRHLPGTARGRASGRDGETSTGRPRPGREGRAS